MIQMVVEVAGECGLKINKGKSNAIMKNWNQDHPERYRNFHELFVKFQFCGKWPWSW